MSTETKLPTQWGDRDQRRIDILRSGEGLLRSGGYDALRMRDVADGAGISLGAVYTYFATKEDLFVGLFAAHTVRMTERLRPQIAASSDFVEMFTLVANEHRDGYPLFGRRLDALSPTAAESVQPRVRRELRAATAGLVSTLAAKLAERGYQGDVRLAMTLLWSAITGLSNHYTTDRREFHPNSWDEAVAFAARTLGRGLDVLD